MDILQWLALFVIALAVVIKAAQVFTDTAEKIGLHFRIPSFIIGVTIIALGTSLPEIATSIISVFQEHPEIVIGNVVGSNIANILLVLAIAAIVGKNLIVNKDIIKIDLPILLVSTVFLFVSTLDGAFSYIDGTLALLMLATYIVYNVKSHREVEDKEKRDISKLKKEEKAKEKKDRLAIKYPILLVISAIFLYFGSDFTVTSVVKISEIFNVGTEIIALTAIAIGTSLPELVVSVGAARKGKIDLAIGNVTGSNIFNALGVMGIPSMFGTLTIPPDIITFSIPALLFVTIIYVFVTMDKEISSWEGITLLILYFAFIGKTIGII